MRRLACKRLRSPSRSAAWWDRQGLGGPRRSCCSRSSAFVDAGTRRTLDPYWQSVLFFPVGIYILLALGLNIVVGQAGLLDLGYVAFYAVGAYTTAKLTTAHGTCNSVGRAPAGHRRWPWSPASSSAGRRCGLRGDYLAIVTLGFGEIVRIIAQNSGILGASRGITGIPHPSSHLRRRVRRTDPLPYYYLVLAASSWPSS